MAQIAGAATHGCGCAFPRDQRRLLHWRRYSLSQLPNDLILRRLVLMSPNRFGS
jgi:hypothetical protein